MSKISVEILSSGKKHVLSAPLNIGRQQSCSIYLDNPILGDKVITIDSDTKGDPIIIGPSGKRLRIDSIVTFDLAVKKYKKIDFLSFQNLKLIKLTGLIVFFLSVLFFGLKDQTKDMVKTASLKLDVDQSNELRIGALMDDLDKSVDQFIVDFYHPGNKLYLKFDYSDLNENNELVIYAGEERIYSSSGFKPCFFKLCPVLLELKKGVTPGKMNRLRLFHSNPKSSYLVQGLSILSKNNADSSVLLDFEQDMNKAIRLYKDSMITSANLVEGLELIFFMNRKLIRFEIPEDYQKRFYALKAQFIEQHKERVKKIEFGVSKSLRLARYDEAKVGLEELKALALKDEYQRKLWINKNLETVQKLMKESKHGK